MKKANLSLTEVMERLVQEGAFRDIRISGDVRDLERDMKTTWARLALDCLHTM